MRDDSAEILFLSFLREVMVSSSEMGRDVHACRYPFRIFSTDHPSEVHALKDGIGEAVVARDMPEPCEFPSLDNRQKVFPGTGLGADYRVESLEGERSGKGGEAVQARCSEYSIWPPAPLLARKDMSEIDACSVFGLLMLRILRLKGREKACVTVSGD